MALTITPRSDGPGRGATRPAFSMGQKPLVLYLATLDLGSSYPTGGFDISGAKGPYDVLRSIESVRADPQVAPGGAGGLTAGHLVTFVWDPTNKKLLVFDNNAQVADTTSLALFTAVPLIALGYR